MPDTITPEFHHDAWRDGLSDTEAPDFQRAAVEMETAGRAWATAKAAAQLLEKTAPGVLAKLVLGFRDAPGDMPMAEAKMRAQASDEWETHIYATAEARHAATLADVRYRALQASFEALRTQEATRRAEMQNLGRQ